MLLKMTCLITKEHPSCAFDISLKICRAANRMTPGFFLSPSIVNVLPLKHKDYNRYIEKQITKNNRIENTYL